MNINFNNFSINKPYNKPLTFNGKKMPIVAIYNNGEYKTYESVIEASKDLNISNTQISSVLKGRIPSVRDIIFAYRKDVLVNNQANFDEIDENKIIEISKTLNNKNKKTTVAIISDGSYKIYESRKQAAYELGICRESITAVASGVSCHSNQIVFVDLKDVAKINQDGSLIYDENNKPQIDEKKVQQKVDELNIYFNAIKEKREQKYIPQLLINPNGTYERHKGITELLKYESFSKNLCCIYTDS